MIPIAGPNSTHDATRRPARGRVYPFSAIVGQDEMKMALLLHAVDPSLGGALIIGERGTGKSTAVRALASLLPPIETYAGCPYHCDPNAPGERCPHCAAFTSTAFEAGGRPEPHRERERIHLPTPVVDLPLGCTEDRILGSLDLEAALGAGEKRFQPGLLAQAHRGFLYIDEVNLLADHLVDLLLDVAASGENIVEREGFSVRHPARFVLVGSGNPEEGDLRPQLLDRFALCARVRALDGPAARVEVLRRRLEFSDDPDRFLARWRADEEALAERIVAARARLGGVRIRDEVFAAVAEIGVRCGVDGHRAELAALRAARALAAFEGRGNVSRDDIRRVAPLALVHRAPHLDPPALAAITDEVVERVFPGSLTRS